MKRSFFDWNMPVPEYLYWVVMVIGIAICYAWFGFEKTILSMVIMITIITWKKYVMEKSK